MTPANRTIRVKVEFNNVNNLVPNLLANMKIRDYAAPDAVQIPSIYIRQDISGNDYVLVTEEKDGVPVVVLKLVEVGKSFQPTRDAISMTEIRNGLQGGEMLITEGYKSVSPGDKVKFPEKEEDNQ